ncbi:hypothetical protein SAMN03159341_101424 [Paenibacillus sp. 1_12]|uniref:hypothetical protein n=1 Tax=Paenibacillus sp. 1_12 TaxID=1566278 RepID=UPI0008E00D6D|nr:hypothetical protein [Paenibacillus sp. 1_12]SFK75539.1 hypothetical protein SAMN03159341_101424 [Paenibacillus sp. 1_12]
MNKNKYTNNTIALILIQKVVAQNDPYQSSDLNDLEKINEMFRMNISFADEWFRFLRLSNIRKEVIWD